MPLVLRHRRSTAKHFIHLIEGVELDMVFIEGGTFEMGSPETEVDRYLTESPVHLVTVPDFCMGKYPVTQAQWRAVANLATVKRPLNTEPSHFQDDSLPVEEVSWLDSEEFCLRLSVQAEREYRLPTEAEWEYACRAGKTDPFHFGKIISSKIANYCAQDQEIGGETYAGKYGEGELGEFRETTTPVGFFHVANNYGLYDMHGNVWEWCRDHWHNSYSGAPDNGSAWINPEAEENAARVLRGGAWGGIPSSCRSAARLINNADSHDDHFGFRVVCPARTL
jgi:formylglycine-generating enzyme required for sulfatase activity